MGKSLKELIERSRLAAAEKSSRPEEVADAASEEREDFKGTIEAFASTFLEIFRATVTVSKHLHGTETFRREIVKHEQFLSEVRSAFLDRYSPEALKRAEGIGAFKALCSLIGELERRERPLTMEAVRFILMEALSRENLKGPLSSDELELARKNKLPLFRGGKRWFAAPGGKKMAKFVSHLWELQRLALERDEERRKGMVAETSRNLKLCFWKGATGVVAAFVPWKPREIYLELEFGENDVLVRDASGAVFPSMIGRAFPRAEIPGILRAAILRGIGEGRKPVEKVKKQSKGKIFHLKTRAG